MYTVCGRLDDNNNGTFLVLDAPAFEAIAASSATFSTAPVQSQVSRLVEIQTLIINSLHAAAPCLNIDFGTPPTLDRRSITMDY